MGKRFGVLLLPAILLGCTYSFHTPHEEIAGSCRQDYPGATFSEVWQDCLDTLAALDIPIREAGNGTIRSRKLEGEGTSGRLFVAVTEEEDIVCVCSYMEVRRDFDVQTDSDSFFDGLFGLDPESKLDDLEDDLDRGRISYSRYCEKRDWIEREIEEREEERDAEWEAADRVLINRLASLSGRFQAALKARILSRQSSSSNSGR